MVDKERASPRYDNIKGLVQDLTEQLDQRMEVFRVGTPFEGVRASDAKTFKLASRQPKSIAKIAKAQDISRQAAHKSVQRLVDRGVVELLSSPENDRDKMISVTPNGQAVRQLAAGHVKQLEAELEKKIGKERLEEFRRTLRDLNK